jgi:AhpD family alkylhydroperoxidase
MAMIDRSQQQKKGEIRTEIEKMFGKVPGWVEEMPDSALEGFWSMMRDFELAETAIPNKYKELIGLAVSGATRCRYCCYFHAEAARLFGASEEEITETALIAKNTMGWSTYLNTMQFDYDEFVQEFDQIAAHVREQMAAGASA